MLLYYFCEVLKMKIKLNPDEEIVRIVKEGLEKKADTVLVKGK